MTTLSGSQKFSIYIWEQTETPSSFMRLDGSSGVGWYAGVVPQRSEGKGSARRGPIIGFRGVGVVEEGGDGADSTVICENPVGEYGNAHLGFMSLFLRLYHHQLPKTKLGI